MANTTFDAQLSYTTGRTGSWTSSDGRVALSVQNVFDAQPPYVDNPAGYAYDPQNASP